MIFFKFGGKAEKKKKEPNIEHIFKRDLGF